MKSNTDGRLGGSGAVGLATGLVLSGFVVSPLAAQVNTPPSQGGVVDSDTATQTATVTVDGSETIVPVIVEAGNGWRIRATSITGALSLDGLPAANPPADAVVTLYARGTKPGSFCDCVELVPGGAVTAVVGTRSGGGAGTPSATITATGVVGGDQLQSGLLARSDGAVGYLVAGDRILATEITPTDNSGSEGFNGSDGGNVAVRLVGAAAVTVSGSVGTGGSGALDTPTLAGITARSVGGAGTTGYWYTGDHDFVTAAYSGNGGTGKTVVVTTGKGSAIDVAQTGANSTAVGILAQSKGGAGASYVDTANQLQAFAGAGGNGGDVVVRHGGAITVTADGGAGIFAASMGGDGNSNSLKPYAGAGLPGMGRDVEVSLGSTASVLMRDGGIGVLAMSHAGDWEPNSSTVLPSGGNVTVGIADGATITTVAGDADPFNFGVLAISTGRSLVVEGDFTQEAGTGRGGKIDVSNAGTITTSGDLAAGIVGLGTGGASIIAASRNGSNIVGNAATTLGASGSAITITNSGTITTAGASAAGIIAISAGGGGIVDNDVLPTFDFQNNVFTGTTLGADTPQASPGTDGGEVTITNSGAITTGKARNGVAAFGILAQSIGGSGGTAGGTRPLLQIGDSGGGGGDGGTVSIDLDAGSAIATYGKNAHGILAQSIGGGGGNGANASGAFVAVGGAGGTGGAGGDVQLTTSGNGSISTYGNYAHGAVVQSIGGGGGNGGIADSFGIGHAITIGGTGGSGGAGGSADIYNNAGSVITTVGNQAVGLLVHSIGGGGGTGGSVNTYSVGVGFDYALAVGGRGGSGGAGGGVSGYNHGSITTGFAPQAPRQAVFVKDTGALYGNLGDKTRFTATFASGGIKNGVVSGTLASFTLGSGEVVANATIDGDTVSGTLNNAAWSQTLVTGGIVDAVADGATGNLVSGLLKGAEFFTPTGAPNLNGADSDGMVVQSIGGGGGRGGAATAKSAVLPVPLGTTGFTVPTISGAFAIGGRGGVASAGGGVTAGNYAAITTYADSSRGILAQSIGGGGGSGGDGTASSTAIQSAGIDVQLALGVGGRGGGGGDGATVTAFNGSSDGSEPGTIATSGQFSSGILAQSIGGGGGVGGIGTASASTPVLHYPTGNSYAASLGVGGTGGDASDGGTVLVYNYVDSTIKTAGSDSRAIHAQSIGGGGGDASGGAASGNGDTASVDLAIGRKGGGGGDGGEIVVENYGTIATTGGGGHGILAQSIGGGGGTGGSMDTHASSFSIPAAVNRPFTDVSNWLNNSTSYDANIAIGGKGGPSGNGGSVGVKNVTSGGGSTPSITTRGERAFGIFAQSVSNSGGVGGASSTNSGSAPPVFGYINPAKREYSVSLSIGGGTGTGGTAGDVGVRNGGTIATTGYGAIGLVAQSVAGGGGYGADASVDSPLDLGVASAVAEGSGPQNLTGGTVEVQNEAGASITTLGADAPAILAQSIGGGGGIASSGSDGFVTVGRGKAGGLGHQVYVGGGNLLDQKGYYATIANPGGLVTVDHDGAIRTVGDWSPGIVAQSIGGGGGYATLYTTDSVALDTEVLVATGVGYGDSLGVTVNLPTGSGIVTGSLETKDGETVRTGYAAFGILAQSIGGGGGFVAENTAGGGTASGSITFGASNSGVGGRVSVTGNADVTTYGDAAHAVVLQSIGGGGGLAGQGSSRSGGGLSGEVALVMVAPSIFATATGGDVSFSSETAIATSGDSAFGILAQSIGGGGGVVFAQNMAQDGNIAGTGVQGINDYDQGGGTVSITLDASSTIATTGTAAHAIVAQSIGGGGGIIGYNDGTGLSLLPSEGGGNQPGSGNKITVIADGTITTTGAGAHGIFAQSIGGGGGMLARDGSLYVGSVGNGSEMGGDVLIQQSGTLSVTGADATAIFAQSTQASTGDGGQVYVGIEGDVTGGSGTGFGVWVDGGLGNVLGIAPGGSLSALSGNAVYSTGGVLTVVNKGTLTGNVLIDGGIFYNDGTFVVGDSATVDGTYDQSGTGTLRFNFKDDTSARLFTNDIALVEGRFDPVVSDWLLPVTNTVVGSALVATINAPIATPSNTVFSWTVTQGAEDATITIAPNADFPDAAGGSSNAKAVAIYLQKEWDAVNGNLAGVFADFYNGIDNPAAYQAVLANLSPEASQTLATHLGDISGTVLGAAMSCPQFEGETTLIGEGTCVWGQGGGDLVNRYDDADSSVSRFFTGIGGQAEIGEGWALGGMVGFDAAHADGDTFSGDGNNYFASLAAKRVIGPWTFAGALAGGFGDYSVDRTAILDGSKLSSDTNAYLVGARLRAAYDFAFEKVYVRPAADLDVYHLHTPSYRERGTSPYALTVSASNDTNVVFTPSVEVGVRENIGAGVVLRGYLNVGAMLTPTADRKVDAALTAASSPNEFRTTIDSPAVAAALKAGLQLYQRERWDARVEYRLEAGDEFLAQGGQLRLSYRF